MEQVLATDSRMASRTFKTLLGRFEADVLAGIPIHSSLHNSPELVSINNVYKMNGFPLNMPFSDVPTLCKAIHNTAVHSTSAPNVEFALAVHCNPYPGRFASVWVYVASLVRQ